VIRLITPASLGIVWTNVSHLLRKTEDYGSDTNHIWNSLNAGIWRLWIYEQDDRILAAATTSFVRYPAGKMLRIETVGGVDMSEWLDEITKLEHFAMKNGCIGMDIFARKGWEKVLKPYGYEFNSILLRKNLKGVHHGM